MLNIPNYQITEQIYESSNSLVYRALRQKDNQPVILKVLNLTKTDNVIVKHVCKLSAIQSIQHLLGNTFNTKTLSSDDFNEDKNWEMFGQIPIYAGWHYGTSARCLGLFGHYQELLELYPQYKGDNEQLDDLTVVRFGF